MPKPKRLIPYLSALAVSVFFLLPHLASASTLPFFGGLDTAIIPCTCEAGAYDWHFFIPLYRSLSAAPTTAGAPVISAAGPLVALTTPTTFSYYSLHPGVWAIGTYLPNSGICMIGVEPYCYSLPNFGLITPFTGESAD